MIVVTKDFSIQIGATFQSFQAGLVIDNPQLEEQFVAEKAPVVEANFDEIVQCPHCRRAFTLKQAVASEDLVNTDKDPSEDAASEEDDEED